MQHVLETDCPSRSIKSSTLGQCTESMVILKLPARIEKKRAGIVVADDELQGRAVSTMALKLHLKQRAVVTK